MTELPTTKHRCPSCEAKTVFTRILHDPGPAQQTWKCDSCGYETELLPAPMPQPAPAPARSFKTDDWVICVKQLEPHHPPFGMTARVAATMGEPPTHISFGDDHWWPAASFVDAIPEMREKLVEVSRDQERDANGLREALASIVAAQTEHHNRALALEAQLKGDLATLRGKIRLLERAEMHVQERVGDAAESHAVSGAPLSAADVVKEIRAPHDEIDGLFPGEAIDLVQKYARQENALLFARLEEQRAELKRYRELQHQYAELVTAFDSYRACQENEDPVHAEWDALCNARDSLPGHCKCKDEGCATSPCHCDCHDALPSAEAAGGEPIEDRARAWARTAHHGQKYGEKDYFEEHLAAVNSVLREHGVDDPIILAAGWLHDVVEDTPIGLAPIREHFPEVVAAIVDACTDGQGATRRERKERSYALIERTDNAIIVKLADRIANVRACVREGNEKLLATYRGERTGFRGRLFHAPAPAFGNSLSAMWHTLDGLLGGDPKPVSQEMTGLQTGDVVNWIAANPDRYEKAVALVDRYAQQKLDALNAALLTEVASLKAKAQTAREEYVAVARDRDFAKNHMVTARVLADGPWQWMASDDNRLETMGEQMALTMTAGTLRGLLAKAGHKLAADAVAQQRALHAESLPATTTGVARESHLLTISALEMCESKLRGGRT